MNYILFLDKISLADLAQVGGKNAGLGELMRIARQQKGVRIPDGFAITADAYWRFITFNKLNDVINDALARLVNYQDTAQVTATAARLSQAILASPIPQDLAQSISQAYEQLCKRTTTPDVDVAVRSSATAEDLPSASFAGAQETFLHIEGIPAVLNAYRECVASLFTARALFYRGQQNLDQSKVALAVGVQQMVRSDTGCAGVAFSLDPESGFKDVVIINATYGLGELLVKGEVTPDEHIVHKPTLLKGFPAIVKKTLGDKKIKLIYQNDAQHTTKTVAVTFEQQQQFCLSDEHVLELARAVVAIEQHFTEQKGSWCPMDIEWALDGRTSTLYIVQARPETVHAQETPLSMTVYQLHPEQALKVIVQGQSVGQLIASGPARVVTSIDQLNTVQEGDILVVPMTNPDWVPVLKKVAGIITERGGRTCHAAIVSRELHIPAIVGAARATHLIKSGQPITIDCSQGQQGLVYGGSVPFDSKTIALEKIPKSPVPLMINMADPDRAFLLSRLPVAGVGLARMEFIINNTIKIHPLALINYDQLTDSKAKRLIDALTAGYSDKTSFFIDQLVQGIATIAAAFYPRPVIVRCSDFKSNEYRNLIGGEVFEPQEENPMLGFRGAVRYFDEHFKAAFALECEALQRVRSGLGLTNVRIMIPFVRTVEEGRAVVELLKDYGLHQGQDGLEIVMMCEIPSNVILLEEFAAIFNGFSIGSNDLMQLTLGVDRDSSLLSTRYSENDPAVKAFISQAIKKSHSAGRPIGICGQGPSDYPEFARFLIEQGIDYLSLNSDSVLPFLLRSY